MYYGRYESRLTFPKSPKQNSCSNLRNCLKLVSHTRYTKIDFFSFFPILQMLGRPTVTYVFGHQESIAAISLNG